MTATRDLPIADANALPPGADHYRAFVGPPDRYDFIGASQFALLFMLGLRETDKVLDFGCGSLRLGRMLIPFLQEGGYFGLEPNAWLIEEGLKRECGADVAALKSPRFAHNADFDCAVFGEKFDFIVAQSIITHAGPSDARRLIETASASLKPGGIFAFSYIRARQDAGLPEEGWHYPGCVKYAPGDLHRMLMDAGLDGGQIPWLHPGALWYLAARDKAALPSVEGVAALAGAPVRER